MQELCAAPSIWAAAVLLGEDQQAHKDMLVVELSYACGSMYNDTIKEDVHEGRQAHIHQVPRTTTSRNKEWERGTTLGLDFYTARMKMFPCSHP